MTDAQAYRFAAETWKRAYKYMTEHKEEFERWRESNGRKDAQDDQGVNRKKRRCEK